MSWGWKEGLLVNCLEGFRREGCISWRLQHLQQQIDLEMGMNCDNSNPSVMEDKFIPEERDSTNDAAE